jgi:hypothetical protein
MASSRVTQLHHSDQWSCQSPLGRNTTTAPTTSSSRWCFDSSYHAILGRPALAKFKVVPHYVYLLLKMLGKTGVLTLHGDLKKSYDCDQEAIEYATTSRVPEPFTEVLAAVLKLTNSEMEISNQRPSQSRVKPNPSNVGIKAIKLQEGDPSKTVLIGGSLGDK